MMKLIQGATLLLATMTTGMMAGVFALYAHTIMPGLGRTDDRTFVAAFQSIDRAILNPWFLPTFMGALGLTLLAALLHVRTDDRAILPWIGAALALYGVAFIVTLQVHVPLNDAIKAAGDPERIPNLGEIRRRFDEARWTSFNLLRVATSLGAFGCLGWSLVLFGRHASSP